MKAYIIILILLSAIFQSACKKDEKIINPVPSISFISVNPDTIQQFTQKMIFTISYTDEDGDLGFEDPDDYSIELKDARLSEPDLYYIKPLAPLGTVLSISGQLDITLNSIFILGSGGIQESTYFSIRIKDRMGHWSNEVISPLITIQP